MINVKITKNSYIHVYRVTQVPSSCNELYDLCAIQFFTLTKDIYESAHVLFLRARLILIFINGWSVKGVQTNRTTDHIHLYCYISRQRFLLPMHVIIGRQYLPLSKRTIRVEHVETLPRSFHILNYMRGRNHRLKKMWVEYVSLLPSPFPPYPCCFLNVRPVPPQF